MLQPDVTKGKYLYCITRCPEPRRFTHLGIGQQGDIVYTVHFKSLAAVVSDSPMIEYDNTRRNMMAHTLVLEEAMQGCTILPVRFGTVGPSIEAIQEKLLARRYDELSGLIAEMEGRVELGLKAFWYEETIFREIVEENPVIRRLRDSLVGRTPEQTYYERIRLGEMIETTMWKKRDQEAEHILDHARPLVHKTRANNVITDRMVLNAAFLVEGARQAEFDQMVKQLDQQMGERLMFKYVGPVPPYNFVNVVVTWDNHEESDDGNSV
jgi:hypothetical protein